MDEITLKAELQSLGLRLDIGAGTRRGGAGPSEGVSLRLGGLEATVPTAAAFAASSPFRLVRQDGLCSVVREGREPAAAELPEEPAFYRESTSCGVPMRMIALRHSSLCIGSTALQACSRRPRCSFCAIDLSLRQGLTIARKTPVQLGETAAAAAREGFLHAVLTSGTPHDEEEGLRRLGDCLSAVREAGLAVQVQCEPPRRLDLLEELAARSDSIGIHVESWDQSVRERVAPGKCDRSLDDYREAWRKAVELWGAGQVSSFLIVGLGESDRSVLEGARVMAEMGVYPFVLPLRPVPGTPLGEASPPRPRRMMRLYEEVACIVESQGLSAADARAGCVRCGACSCITDITG